MKIILFTLVFIFSSPLLATSFNVISEYPEEDQYIRVEDKNERLVFMFCSQISTHCEIMGNASGYSIDELTQSKNAAIWKTAGSAVADIAAGIAAFFGGGYVAATYIGANMSLGGAIATGAAGGATSATVTEFIALSMDALNPWNHYDKAVLFIEVLEQEQVEKSDILAFKNQLELLLDSVSTN